MMICIYLKSGAAFSLPVPEGRLPLINADSHTGQLISTDIPVEAPYSLRFLDPASVAAIVMEPGEL